MRTAKERNATPYIAFKVNAKLDPKADAKLKPGGEGPEDNSVEGGKMWNAMWHFYNLNRASFLDHYHKRSNVESTFSMIKAKFGDSLRSKGDVSMENELLCKILCHNICVLVMSIHELGIEPMLGE